MGSLRLLGALVLIGLAALMLAGSLTEVSRARPAPHIPTQIERPREEQPLQRRRSECQGPADFVILVTSCA